VLNLNLRRKQVHPQAQPGGAWRKSAKGSKRSAAKSCPEKIPGPKKYFWTYLSFINKIIDVSR